MSGVRHIQGVGGGGLPAGGIHASQGTFIPRHLKKCGVLCYTLKKNLLSSVRPSVRPSVCLSVRPSAFRFRALS